MPSRARRMASLVAPRMLTVSISATLAVPKFAWICPCAINSSNSAQSPVRSAAVICFESLTRPDLPTAQRPSRNSCDTSTAAATTGPARAPRPASSTPIRLLKPKICLTSNPRSWRRLAMRVGWLPLPLLFFFRHGQRQFVELARRRNHLGARAGMQLGKMAERPSAEFLDEPRRLRLRFRAGALLELVAELPRQCVHATDKFGPRHNRRRGDDGVLLGLGTHREAEPLELALLQLALNQRLLGKLVEQTARHPFLFQGVFQRGRMVGGK